MGNQLTKNTVLDERTLAAVSYFGFYGLIAAFLLKKNNKNEAVHFHLRQACGILALKFAFTLLLPLFIFLFPSLFLVSPLILISKTCFSILITLGIINVATERMSQLPVIGKKSEEFFQVYKIIKPKGYREC